MAEADRARAMALKAKLIRARSTAVRKASTQPQQQAVPDDPDDPETGIETALKNTWKYATDVSNYISGLANTYQDELFVGSGDELGAIAPATFKYILAGPKGKKSWGQIYDQELKGGQKRIKKFAKENPWTAGIAGAAGMATSAIPTMGVGMGAAAVRVGAKTAGKATTQALGRPDFLRRASGGAAAAGPTAPCTVTVRVRGESGRDWPALSSQGLWGLLLEPRPPSSEL